MDRDGLASMIVSLHEHFKIRITDWLLSAMLLSWGFALMWTDPRVWALPTFSGLARIADQQTWAVVALIIGLSRLSALFVNGAVRRSPHLRAIGAFLTCFIWVQLTLGFLWSDLAGPGIALFPWLALADAFNVYRAAMDAGASDKRAKRRQVAHAVPHRP